ncbi:MAG: D-alanyl-D-alanine carboxypeptidase family protein [Paracoccaceae bacterium]
MIDRILRGAPVLWAALLRRIATGMFVLVATIAAVLPARAVVQSTPSEAAIVVDMSSGAILLEKNADMPIPPASMSKLMTLEVVFDALESGRLGLEDQFRTSARASSMGGSKMFIREGESVSVENLLRGIVVHSGNDAAVALAEALTGTEEAFAAFLNKRAEAIGLTGSHFVNSTGWPHPEHVMTVRDLARLGERIIREYGAYYPYFIEEEFTWDDITQRNRNPLLGEGLGVDGLKTGHTEEAGFGLVASAKRGDRRVLIVVTGLATAAPRRQEVERLINWAFRAFETRRLFAAGEPLLEASVWIGERDRVPLAPAEDVIVTLPIGTGAAPDLIARYREPFEAPVEAGAALGAVLIRVEGLADVEVPLVATETVGRGGFIARVQAAAHLAVSRILSGDGTETAEPAGGS